MNEEMGRYYQILGIKAEASDKDVYDSCGFIANFYKDFPNSATGKIKEINEAYEKIMAHRRKQYPVDAVKPDATQNKTQKEHDRWREEKNSYDTETKKCPFCAEEIKSEAIKCRYCGERLVMKSTTADSDDHGGNQDKLCKQGYSLPHEAAKVESPPESSPQQSKIFKPPIEKPKEEGESLYEAILGKKNHIYYRKKFKEFDQQPPGLKASWNWAAFFGGGFWALYRKMYGWLFAYLGIAFLSIILEKGDAPVFSAIVLSVPWVAFTIFANSLYHGSVKKKIALARRSIRDKSKLLEFLRHKGGVHTWVIWVGVLLPAIGILAAIAIPQFTAYKQRSYNAARLERWNTLPPETEAPTPASVRVPESAAHTPDILIGKALTDEDASTFLNQFGDRIEHRDNIMDRIYYIYKQSGIELICNPPDWRINTVFLYSADGNNGRYIGKLPKNLLFSDSRAEVRRKLGMPSLSGGGESGGALGKILIWDKYYFFPTYSLHVQYSENGTINMITLSEID